MTKLRKKLKPITVEFVFNMFREIIQNFFSENLINLPNPDAQHYFYGRAVKIVA